MKEGISRFVKSNSLVGLYLVLIVLTLFYIFSYNRAPLGSISSNRQIAHVVEVIDGDTVNILAGDKVRLIGINAPEKGDPYSVEAKERLENLIGGRDVLLEYDNEKRDHYNRLLAYIYVGDLFVNKLMAGEGLAYSYIVPPNDRYEYEIEVAEREAEQERLGIWSSLK